MPSADSTGSSASGSGILPRNGTRGPTSPWIRTVIANAAAVPAARPISFDGSAGQRLRTTTNTTIVTSPTSSVQPLMPP